MTWAANHTKVETMTELKIPNPNVDNVPFKMRLNEWKSIWNSSLTVQQYFDNMNRKINNNQNNEK